MTLKEKGLFSCFFDWFNMDILTMISIPPDVLQLSIRCIFRYILAQSSNLFFSYYKTRHILNVKKEKRSRRTIHRYWHALLRHGSSIFVHFERGSFFHHRYHSTEKKGERRTYSCESFHWSKLLIMQQISPAIAQARWRSFKNYTIKPWLVILEGWLYRLKQ